MVSKFLQYPVSFRTDPSGFLPLAQVCLVLMAMTNLSKKNSELMVGVTGRVVRHWNRL